MSDVAHEGRTVLFVSHNMAAVRAICSTAIHLRRGMVVARGPVGPVVDELPKLLQGVKGPSKPVPLHRTDSTSSAKSPARTPGAAAGTAPN